MASDLTRLQTVTKAADSIGRDLAGTTRSGATHQSILEEMYEWAKLRIARAYSFPELDVVDTTTADTVADTKTYTYTTLFGAAAATKVKDILSLVIEDGTSSRKVKQLLYREFDKRFPYPEGETTRKPFFYTVFANQVEFIPVPDAVYDIHSRRSIYPTRATGDGSTAEFNNIDDLILVGTIVEYFSYLQEFKDASSWNIVWKAKLKDAVRPYIHPKDWEPEGRAFNSAVLTPGDFWKDPLVFENR